MRKQLIKIFFLLSEDNTYKGVSKTNLEIKLDKSQPK